MLRNILVIAGAVVLGVIVMQPFMAAQQCVTEGRTFPGVVGMLLLQVISLVPTIVAAGAMAAVAALGVRADRPEGWAAVVFGAVAGLLIVAQHYVAPDWVAWLTTIVHIAAPAVVAWLLFNLVWRRRKRSLPAA